MKNKKRISIFLLLFLVVLNVTQAQFERTAGRIVTDKKPGGIIEAYTLEKTELVEGSFFINNDWYMGNVSLRDGRIMENVPLKYNLRDDLLHIRDSLDGSRVIASRRIEEFQWFNFDEKKTNRYINGIEFNLDGVPMTGMVEILVEGKASLIVYRNLEIQKAMYSVIHDAGQKHDEYIINEFYYIHLNDGLYRIKNKKSLEGIFEGQEENMMNFIRENHLTVKNSGDLSRIVIHYNSLEWD